MNLRSGKFRNAVTDRELGAFIRDGSRPACRPFKLDNAEMAGIIAYLRNMNAFDAASVQDGRRRARPRGLRRQGRLRELPSRRADGSRVAPNLSDIGAVRSAGVAGALAARPDQPDDADQPAGARGHEGRHGRSTAGGSTRTPTACS